MNLFTNAVQLATLMIAGGTLGYLLGPYVDSAFWAALWGAGIHFAGRLAGRRS
jgi:hypothetical protein